MSDFPDLLGMELESGKALLEAEGLDFIVLETKPTKKQLESGTFRIIKMSSETSAEDKRTIELTVCLV